MMPEGEWSVRVVTPGAAALSLAEAKTHLRVDQGDEDSFITDLVAAATEWLEQATGLALMQQTVLQVHETFPADAGQAPIELLRAPVASVDWVKYLDDADATQTVAATSYRLEADASPPRVLLKIGEAWPPVIRRAGAVKIQYVAGAADVANVPERARQCLRLLVGHLYENREATISGTIIQSVPQGLRALVAQLRAPRLV